MSVSIDPDSPVPLYYQIAESIRTAIESGSLRPGDALTPLGEAAESWGVNVHTVRHPYTSLARDGLLKAHRGLVKHGSLPMGDAPREMPGTGRPSMRFSTPS